MNTLHAAFPFTVWRGPIAIRALEPDVFEVTKQEYFPPPFDITAGRDLHKKERPGRWAQVTYRQDRLPLDLFVFASSGGVFRWLKRKRLLKRWVAHMGEQLNLFKETT